MARITTALSLAAVFLTACPGAPPEPESPDPAVLSDAEIAARIQFAFYRDGLPERERIEVRVVEGHVRLAGRVSSAEIARRADELARDVPGVRSVSADLEIAPP
jgi:osmotically-inducible protein OsmY